MKSTLFVMLLISNELSEIFDTFRLFGISALRDILVY